ncbi:MAG: c-type cytochrome [Candidatus Methanoperedens sp.]|nr:c-type cytochrome [Candidatus Methanoperedens sp.]
MNNNRLILIGLLIPALLMIPFSIISFYTDFANRNPDPLAVTVNFNQNTYNAVEGKKAFEQYQCMGCHTIVGNGAYFAPDMTTVYKRMGENDAALSSFILAGAPAKGMQPMRDRGMKEDDAYRITAFLKYTDMLDTNGWPGDGSWERDGNPDSTSAKKLDFFGIWQVVSGIVFINVLIFAIILAYENKKMMRGLE